MPRTGGVFSLLSGSKGSPNTTIQSVPYNAQLDDFAQDANLPRPITAGGTGATTIGDAKTNLGLAAVASSGSASDLTTGTLADARLPSLMSSKEFTNVTVRTGSAGVNGFLQDVAGDSTHSGYVAFHQKDNVRAGYIGYADVENKVINLTVENSYKYNFAGAVPTIDNVPIWYGNNDGAGSGLDADLLDGQQGSFYQNASNLSAGTVNDARLPSSQSGKQFTSYVSMVDGLAVGTNANPVIELGRQDGASSQAFIDFHTSAVVRDYNARIMVYNDNPGADGASTLAFQCGDLYHNGNVIWDYGTMTPVSQAEAEAGTGTTNRAWTAQRVKQAISAQVDVKPFNGPWKDFSSSRSGGTTYQNTSSKWRAVISGSENNGNIGQVSPDGANWLTMFDAANLYRTLMLVPPQWFYRAFPTAGALSWLETEL